MTKILLSFAAFILLVSISGCEDYKKKNLNPKFHSQLVSALNLKLVATDSMYHGSTMRIAHDTIFGYFKFKKPKSWDDDSQNYYFIQDLNNLKKIYKISSDYNYPVGVDTLDGGKFYFSAGGISIVSIDTNGNHRQYFKKYNDSMFNASSIMLFKNRASIRSMNGLYVFDIINEKLLWKYKFPSTGIIDAKTILGKLVFPLTKDQNQSKTIQDSLLCVDLDSAKYSWKIGFKGEDLRGGVGTYSLFKNKISGEIEKRIYVGTNKRALALNLENGKIVHADSNYSSIQPTNKSGFLARKRNDCFLLDEAYHPVWRIKNFIPIGFHDDFIIGTSLNRLNYFIFNTSTGKLVARIAIDDPEDLEFFMMGSTYILIDNIYLYK